MEALFNSINRARESIKWGLALHTAAMFTFATVYTATTLDLQSISFIDNREFPGADGVMPSGPVGYQLFVYSNAIGVVPRVMCLLNNWLTDGLLVGFVSNSIAEVSTELTPAAVSVLYNLRHESLGHSVPMSNVSCIF